MIQAISWVLIHSLWQGVLLALAGGGVILSTKRSTAAIRYRLLCGLCGLFLAGLGLTFFYECEQTSWGGTGNAGAGISVNWFGAWCSEHAYLIVLGWLAIAVLKSVRMAVGWNYIWQMRREGMTATALWKDRIAALSAKIGLRRTVRLVESGLVRVPMVIGQLKPIVYIPLGLINHLPGSEMEAVLLHELAHIRRYDHVVNMVQQMAECLLFFNPGFLWMSAIIREERENSCDDMAIAHTGDPVEFVRALVRFKEHSVRDAALAFPGNSKQLLHRVLRISRRENKTLSGRERIVLLLACFMVIGLLIVKIGRISDPVKAKAADIQLVKATAPEVNATDASFRTEPELAAVLRTRQQVAKNMAWVQAQLDQLHHPDGARPIRTVTKRVSAEQRLTREEQERSRLDQERNGSHQERDPEMNPQQAGNDRQQRDKVQTSSAREQAERDRRQAELARHQAELDRQQAGRDREQAERDREQAERDRQQAERDRLQADKDRRQAERNQQQADKDRQQAERNRHTAEEQSIDQHQ